MNRPKAYSTVIFLILQSKKSQNSYATVGWLFAAQYKPWALQRWPVYLSPINDLTDF